jgi:protein farnesyltransferase/geranylgeranyltransferase type-1 subunit alpha
MLTLDSKNHHVWSYRQWMVSHFELWDEPTEWNVVESLLAEDVRNNSAWNHRWFLVFGGSNGGVKMGDVKVVTREWDWALEKARLAPQNESAWNYLRALVERASGPAKFDKVQVIKDILPLVYGTSSDGKDIVTSSYGLDVLAELYAEIGEVEKAEEALDQLARKWDPIREGYWKYRKNLLGKSGEKSGIQPEARVGGEVAASA